MGRQPRNNPSLLNLEIFILGRSEVLGLINSFLPIKGQTTGCVWKLTQRLAHAFFVHQRRNRRFRFKEWLSTLVEPAAEYRNILKTSFNQP